MHAGSATRQTDGRPVFRRHFDSGTSSESTSEAEGKPSKALMRTPSSTPNNLLLVSLLEHVCHLHVVDPAQRDQLFKMVCGMLAEKMIISPVSFIDEFGSTRTQLRSTFLSLLHSAVAKLNQPLLPPKVTSLKLFLAPGLDPHTPSHGLDEMAQLFSSRYRQEFAEIKRLGRGGFGVVVKAHHKLDGQEYAIKKISLQNVSPDLWFKILREVKALSSLHHENIVRYHSAWLEHTFLPVISDRPYERQSASSDDDSADSCPCSPRHTFDSCYSRKDSNIVFSSNSNSGIARSSAPKDNAESEGRCLSSHPKSCSLDSRKDVSETCQTLADCSCDVNEAGEGSSNAHVAGEEDKPEHDKKAHSNDCDNTSSCFSRCRHKSFSDPGQAKGDNGALVPYHAANVFQRTQSFEPTDQTEALPPSGWNLLAQRPMITRQSTMELVSQLEVTLFIQMQLCDFTLQKWLRTRNAKLSVCPASTRLKISAGDSVVCVILKQILKGIDYVHQKGLLHRDMKPGNIFLSEDYSGRLSVLIGDFGLTREVASVLRPMQLAHKSSPSSSGPFTADVGTSTYASPEQLKGSACSSADDMYSIGMMMVELYHPFTTEMERAKSLNSARHGILPQELYTSCPEQAQIIRRLLQSDPSRRPSSRKLLSSNLFLTRDELVELLRDEVRLRDARIGHLQQAVANRDATIQNLNRRLKVLEQDNRH